MNKAKSFLALACAAIIVITCVSLPAAAHSPQEPLSRGNAVQMLFDSFYFSQNDGKTQFVDVVGKPYTEAVVWAQERGLVEGDGNKRFEGERPISRAETAVLLYRLSRNLLKNPADFDVPVIGKDAYEDEADIPSWAIEAVRFTVAAGYFPLENRLFRPSETVTKDAFAEIIKRVQVYELGVQGRLVYPDQIDYSGVIASDTQTGARLHLGMSVSALEGIFPNPFENGWTYYMKGAFITCLNDSVISITASSRNEENHWDFNGVSKKSVRSEVEKALGKPAVATPKGSLSFGLPLRDIDTYSFNSQGKAEAKPEASAYFLDIEYNDDGSVYNIVLSNFNGPENNFSIPQPLAPTGWISFRESGKGNASITNPVGQTICLSIAYTGTGDFSLLDGGAELFSHTGPYTGTILLNDMDGKKLDIRAEGDWRLTGMYSLNSSKYLSVRSGSGDYVLPVVTLFGKYQVSHQGEGPFAVKWVPAATGMPMQEIVIADATGSYTGTYDFGTTVFPGYVVIKADGNWTFGPLREYTVVE